MLSLSNPLFVPILCVITFPSNVFLLPAEWSWTAQEALSFHKYPNEVHTVTTEDGYILQINRITGGRNNQTTARGRPVVLSHPLTQDAYCFLVFGPQRALGYLLADSGFDVWMINHRGTLPSRNHTDQVAKKTYWNFSWHEMGVFDLAACVDYILSVTGQDQVYHAGSSQGTTVAYVLLAERPDYNRKIRAEFSYAPSNFECHTTNLIYGIIAAPEYLKLETLFVQVYGSFNVVGSGLIFKFLAIFCSINEPILRFCRLAYSAIGNSRLGQMDLDALPTVIAHTITGMSLQAIVHYTQSKVSCGFGPYVKSVQQNKRTEYDLSKVEVPIYVYHSSYDQIADYRDVVRLNSSLPRGFADWIQINGTLGHVDFIYGINATNLVYYDTIKRLHALENTNM